MNANDLPAAPGPWADELNCAVTVCDTESVVLYQNLRSIEVNGDVRGRSMIPCHNERSRGKLIYHTVRRTEGTVRGLVEFSLEIPAEMPHYVRG